jgi:hypothetical protein
MSVTFWPSRGVRVTLWSPPSLSGHERGGELDAGQFDGGDTPHLAFVPSTWIIGGDGDWRRWRGI